MSQLKLIYGTWHAPFMEEAIIRSALEYEPHPGDVFICTYPKCGTNWMHTIVSLILNKGGPLQFRVGVADTFFEFVGREVIEELPPPRLIPTHLKQSDIAFVSHAKYIHVARNPKDACLSDYCHLKISPDLGMVIESLEQFVDDYVQGYVPFGGYPEHFVSWYKYKDAPNVLFLTYEDLKQDFEGNVKKIAEFLGREYSDVLLDESVFESIVERCSLESMYEELSCNIRQVEDAFDKAYQSTTAKKGLHRLVEGCNLDTPPGEKKRLFDPSCFVRKGEVGGWREIFNEEMSRKIEKKFLEVTKGLDISGVWINTVWTT